MGAPDSDQFWEDLLDLVADGRVIPVVGERAVTFGPDNTPLYPWLAGRLAARLGLEASALPSPLTLNDVVCAWLLRGEDRNVIYTRLARLLREECPEAGSTLRDLAAIPAFNLFLTTTFDPLLEQALNAGRYEGQKLTKVASFSPGAESKDLPARKRDLTAATVYHVLGRASSGPEYVVWEEDMLEFICGLHQHMPQMLRLSCDLKEHGLLILGLNFSDWLLRFFLRVARQDRLSSSRHADYLADGPHEMVPRSLVLFFGGVSKRIQVVPTDPADFAAELRRRWDLRYPRQACAGGVAIPGFSTTKVAPMPEGAIFLSYAREDEAAAVQLKRGLEAAGCVVWYDRERLKPGGHWHNHLHDEVFLNCGLFVSVVSRFTESSASGYFHQERNWAAERAGQFAEGEPFYVPVLVEDTPMPPVREPRAFRRVHGTRLPGGVVEADFARHLYALQQSRLPATATPRP